MLEFLGEQIERWVLLRKSKLFAVWQQHCEYIYMRVISQFMPMPSPGESEVDSKLLSCFFPHIESPSLSVVEMHSPFQTALTGQRKRWKA
jgi:hypothetical protein